MMNRLSIDIAVNEVLRNHWDWKVPVDLKRIAQSLNIRVEPLSQLEQQEGISGSAFIDENNRMVAKYSPNESTNRQRFTIAHELGHFLLNHVTRENTRYRADRINSFSSRTFDPSEAEANEFAANVLMPKPAIEHFMNNTELSSVEELASAFQVSEAAMYYRLKNLNLI